MRGQDYTPEVQVGARCLNMSTGTLGTIVDMRDLCHWRGADEWDSNYRPRAAYVLEDDAAPRRSGFHADAPYSTLSVRYVAPEALTVVPPTWLAPMGLQAARETVRLIAPSLAVLRYRRGWWWLLNKRDKGFGEFGYRLPHLGALRAAWGCVPVGKESAAGIMGYGDEHGVFWRVVDVCDLDAAPVAPAGPNRMEASR